MRRSHPWPMKIQKLGIHVDRPPGRAPQLLAAARPDDHRTTIVSTSRIIRSTACMLHPEMPSYEDQIKARDNFVAAHPGAAVRGRASRQPGVRRRSHRRVSRSLPERIPRHGGAHEPGAIPVGARHRKGAGVLRALPGPAAVRHRSHAESRWTIRRNSRQKRTTSGRATGAYLATDESQRVEIIKADVPGLALPREVIDKVYYGNAARAFALEAEGGGALRRAGSSTP